MLKTLETFDMNLDDYLHLVIPAVVRLIEQAEAALQLRQASIRTLARLCRTLNFADFTSRIIHPLVRVLDDPKCRELREDVMDTLCIVVYELGPDFAIFIPLVNKILNKNRIQCARY